MNCTETKKRMIVGNRERVTKARTNLVLSLAPIILFFLSKEQFDHIPDSEKEEEEE